MDKDSTTKVVHFYGDGADDDDSKHDEDDPNLESGVVLASLSLIRESCHCFEIHSISQDEFKEDVVVESDGEDEDNADDDEDEMIQLLK